MATSEDNFSEIEQKFNAASKHLPSILSKVESPDLLYFYARFKQATVGPCNTEKPGFFDFKGMYLSFFFKSNQDVFLHKIKFVKTETFIVYHI